MSSPGRVVLLGPQRHERSVGAVAQELFPEGPVATITAGWQEWEGDDEALDEDLGGRSLNLGLYDRSEEIFTADPELRRAHKAVQEKIRLLTGAYRRRLDLAYRAWEAVDRMMGDDSVLGPEREAAFRAIRALDERQTERMAELRAEYETRHRPLERRLVARHRRDIETRLEDCTAVVVEGGHVPVLVNRLRLFGLGDLLGGRLVAACAGGAMALSSRIVFFHDAPPQGPARPETGDVGCALFQGVVVLPDAARRLDLENGDRVSRFARRFAPDSCLTLDGGNRVDWDGTGWQPVDVRHLTAEGKVKHWEASR